MLTSDRTRTVIIGGKALVISEKLIPDSARANKDCASWCKRGQPMKPCRKLVGGVGGVTIHNTGDLGNVEDDAECYTRATFPNCNMGGVAVHYYLDDVSCWQLLREDEQGWHAADGTGPGNTTTIAIEVIMDGKGGDRDRLSEERAAILAAHLLEKYGLGIDRLYTHNHWMGQADKIVPWVRKNCPLFILPHWGAFREAVAGLMGVAADGEADVAAEKPDEATYTVVRGDTLYHIAQMLLGDGRRYPEIMALNDLESRVVFAGMRLRIPGR